MSKKDIQHILCAVRGVPQSRKTVGYAIQFALDHQARLTFAHVNDADFIGNAVPTLTSLQKVYKQMREMSMFTLLVLCDRAKRRGVEQVDYQILDGRFLAQIKALLHELQPDILVIGRPVGAVSASSSLPQEDLEKMIEEIHQQTHTTVHPVEIHVEA